MESTPYKLNQRVRRIEDRPHTAALVVAIEEGPFERSYLLAYVEGGDGWWPENAIRPAED